MLNSMLGSSQDPFPSLVFGIKESIRTQLSPNQWKSIYDFLSEAENKSAFSFLYAFIAKQLLQSLYQEGVIEVINFGGENLSDALADAGFIISDTVASLIDQGKRDIPVYKLKS